MKNNKKQSFLYSALEGLKRLCKKQDDVFDGSLKQLSSSGRKGSKAAAKLRSGLNKVTFKLLEGVIPFDTSTIHIEKYGEEKNIFTGSIWNDTKSKTPYVLDGHVRELHGATITNFDEENQTFTAILPGTINKINIEGSVGE